MAVLHGNMEHAVALLKKLESDTLGEEGGAAAVPPSVRIALTGFPFVRTEMAGLWEETARDIVKQLGAFPYLQWAFAVLLSNATDDKSILGKGDLDANPSGSNAPGFGQDSIIGGRYLRLQNNRKGLYGHYESVLRPGAIKGISLADRIAIGCMFLPKRQLYAYLQSLILYAEKKGDLEGLLLLGIHGVRGMKLIVSYVNRTGDLQTAALLVSYGAMIPLVDPSCRLSAQTFVAAYREILNRWELFKERARFDCDRAIIERKRSSAPVPWVPKSKLGARCGFWL